MPVHATISVDLGERSYPIVIGSGLLGGGYDLGSPIEGPDCLVVTNETVGPLYRQALLQSLEGKTAQVLELEDGEQFKTPNSVAAIIDKLVDMGANRDTTLVALGGGVVGDITGFAAATYMRGVPFVQVPTTLLSQVDSSVGGKTGVNHAGGKNLIGAFHQPQRVLIDTDTLRTLADRELSAGLAEVIKHGAIADIDYLTWLEANMAALRQRDAGAMAKAIARSCEIKAGVVAEDEREQGRRAVLNFGHTFGHAIENTVGYGQWLHGEAVAVGMLMAAELSDVTASERERLRKLIEAAGLPTDVRSVDADKLGAAMKLDKKVVAKRLRFILLRSLGDAYVTSDYDEQRLLTVLNHRGC